MSTKAPNDVSQDDEPGGDPWAAFGYLVAGVGFYGGIGFGLSVWLDAPYLIPIGILVGAAFGVYLVFARFRYRAPAGSTPSHSASHTKAVSESSTAHKPIRTPIDNDRPAVRDNDRDDRPDDRDDRGEAS